MPVIADRPKGRRQSFSTRGCRILLMLWSFVFATVASAADVKPDVRVLIDISGSMKNNDPSNLRVPALNLLVDLLPEGSRSGVWTFGTYTNELVPHKDVTNQWRQDARARSRDITSSAMFTDIENALERASYDANRPDSNFDRHIILLTDGLVDISESRDERRKRQENNESRDSIQFDLLPKLKKAGYTIHTVALSDNADKDLMLKLAQRTGGLAAVANNAEELMQLFMQALDRTAPSEQVPLENNRFLVDSSINEFTALIFHKPDSQRVFLISPKGERYTSLTHPDNVRWHYESRYDLITVADPEDGEWLVETEMHPDNRVTVVSDLSLKVSDVPATLFRGLSLDIEASIQEEGETITRPEFLRIVSMEAQQVADSDQVLKSDVMTGKPGAAGSFVTKLGPFNTTGNYRIQVNLDGKTFQRSVSQPVFVQDIVSSNVDYDDANEPQKVFFTKVLPELKASDLTITAQVNGLTQKAQLASQESWVLDLPQMNREKEQKIRVFASGTVQGKAFDVELDPVIIPPLNPEPQVETLDQPGDMGAQPIDDSASGSGGGSGFGADDDKPKKPMNLLDPNDQPLESSKPGDANLLWVYLAVALANIALFAGAFWLYKRFVQRRMAARQQARDSKRDDDLSL
ncbi:MAG: vWA domain-containing protein [Oceanospirillum sp.]|nr:vWA domain-containing protein [Oceanospirillum sp.]